MGREQKWWKEGGGGVEKRTLLSPPPPPPSIFALAPFSAFFVVALFPARPSRGPLFRLARTGKGTLATQANRPDEPILLENNSNSVSFKTGIETPLSSAEARSFFFGWGGVDLLRNVSADTGLPATADSAGVSTRHHTQDQVGRHPGEAIFCLLLSGVACVPSVSKDGGFAGQRCLRFS